MNFNSKEDLQKELDQIDKDIKKAQLKVSNLLIYRETIAMRLNELMEGKRKVVNTSKFDNADDPIKELLNSLDDSDEIRIEDVAYLFGISVAVLLAKIDTKQLRVFKYSNKRTSRTGKVLKVGYLKKLLEKYNGGDIEKRRFVETLLKEYHENGMSLNVKHKIKDLLLVPEINHGYDELTLKQLIIAGFNRGFIKFTHYNTMLKMLDSFNCKYTLDYSSYRVMEKSTCRFIRVYSK